MALTKIPGSLIDTSSGINGLIYPSSDGTNGQAIITDGSGTLSFSSVTPDQTLTVIGRSSNLGVNLTSATLTIVGRSGNINVGV
jgi:hypothetical protein